MPTLILTILPYRYSLVPLHIAWTMLFDLVLTQ